MVQTADKTQGPTGPTKHVKKKGNKDRVSVGTEGVEVGKAELKGTKVRELEKESVQQVQAEELKPVLALSALDSLDSLPLFEGPIEHIQKRIRNLQKRKQRIDKYQEMYESEDPVVRASLNEDQMLALRNKESVEAPLKDLAELLVVCRTQVDELRASLASVKAQAAQEAAQRLAEAQDAKLELAVKFLRAASFKRQATDSTPDVRERESKGLEYLLSTVYKGNHEAVEAVSKLQAGSTEPIAEGTISYAEARTIALTDPQDFFRPKPVEEPVVEPAPKVQSISFLQEEELEVEAEEAKEVQVKDKESHKYTKDTKGPKDIKDIPKGPGNANANGQGNGHANGHANGQANGYANGHANGQANGYANGHANGQANGHSNQNGHNGHGQNGQNGQNTHGQNGHHQNHDEKHRKSRKPPRRKDDRASAN